MPTPLEQLATAQAEVARLSGFESQFNALQAQIPGGNLTAFLAEHTRRGTELERLQGVEAQWNAIAGQVPGGNVTAFMAEHTRRGTEIERLTGELAGFDERVENRAAEIVANTGNQPPAAAETTTAAASAEPASFEDFRAEHGRLMGENPAKAGSYYSRWGQKFGF